MKKIKKEIHRRTGAHGQPDQGLRKTSSVGTGEKSEREDDHDTGDTMQPTETGTRRRRSGKSDGELLKRVGGGNPHKSPESAASPTAASPSILCSEDTSRNSGHSTACALPESPGLDGRSCAAGTRPKPASEEPHPTEALSPGQELVRLTREIRNYFRKLNTACDIADGYSCPACTAARKRSVRKNAGSRGASRRPDSRTQSGGSASSFSPANVKVVAALPAGSDVETEVKP
jgi:hypothetical protein